MNYWPLEVNLGIANGGLDRDRAADGPTFQARSGYATALAYFERALAWCPNYYARCSSILRANTTRPAAIPTPSLPPARRSSSGPITPRRPQK